jgi:hypothetical protein
MLYTEFVGEFINTGIYTKFQVPQPISLTVIGINVEAKETHRRPCCFKFSIVIFTVFYICRRYVTTQFRIATMIILLMVEN